MTRPIRGFPHFAAKVWHNLRASAASCASKMLGFPGEGSAKAYSLIWGRKKGFESSENMSLLDESQNDGRCLVLILGCFPACVQCDFLWSNMRVATPALSASHCYNANRNAALRRYRASQLIAPVFQGHRCDGSLLVVGHIAFLVREPKCRTNLKRVFALLTPKIRSQKMAQMLQKPLFALLGCQRMSENTLLCDTLKLADFWPFPVIFPFAMLMSCGEQPGQNSHQTYAHTRPPRAGFSFSCFFLLAQNTGK